MIVYMKYNRNWRICFNLILEGDYYTYSFPRIIFHDLHWIEWRGTIWSVCVTSELLILNEMDYNITILHPYDSLGE